MDRTAFAACAGFLSLAIVAGCDKKPGPPPQDHAPLVLAELQAASPGPWRGAKGDPVSPTSLEHLDHARPVPLHATPGDDSNTWTGQESALPLGTPPAGDANAPELRFIDRDASQAPPDASAGPESPLRNLPIEPAEGDQSSVAPLPLDEATLPSRPAHVLRATERLPAAPPPPSPEMLTVLRQAEAHVQQGITLAERHALFLARAEYLAALQMIAQAHDLQENSQRHTDALTAGMIALEESVDFVRPRRVGKKIDLKLTLGAHQTPILKSSEAVDEIAPVVAAERYYAYAQQQLAAAAAHEPAASRALFGLGKLAIAVGHGSHTPEMQTSAQARVYYQAALLADPRNGRAANELAVIVAQRGDLRRARDLLAHSVQVTPHPSTHRNLAQVAAKLGETQLADAANRHAVAMEQAGYRRSGPAVEWLDPATFAATAPASDAPLPPAAPPAAQAQKTAPPADVSTARKGINDWLPWNPRR
jgi:tetratricopeptide (TPR) repeat protein